MRPINQLNTRQVERIAATDGHPLQAEAEEELWIRTPPPDPAEEYQGMGFPPYVKIVLVPALYGWGFYIEDSLGQTLASAPNCSATRTGACQLAVKTRRGPLPDDLPF